MSVANTYRSTRPDGKGHVKIRYQRHPLLGYSRRREMGTAIHLAQTDSYFRMRALAPSDGSYQSW